MLSLASWNALRRLCRAAVRGDRCHMFSVRHASATRMPEDSDMARQLVTVLCSTVTGIHCLDGLLLIVGYATRVSFQYQ